MNYCFYVVWLDVHLPTDSIKELFPSFKHMDVENGANEVENLEYVPLVWFLYALLPYGLLSTEVPFFIYLDSYCIVVGPFLTSWFLVCSKGSQWLEVFWSEITLGSFSMVQLWFKWYLGYISYLLFTNPFQVFRHTRSFLFQLLLRGKKFHWGRWYLLVDHLSF